MPAISGASCARAAPEIYVAEQLGHGAEQTLRTYGHVIAEYRGRPPIDAAAEIRLARGPGAARRR